MLRLIEYLLNGLVYALHGYAWAIKNNPLTIAWRNIDKSDWGKFKAPSGASEQFEKNVRCYRKAQQRMNNPAIGNRHLSKNAPSPEYIEGLWRKEKSKHDSMLDDERIRKEVLKAYEECRWLYEGKKARHYKPGEMPSCEWEIKK